MTKRLLLFVGAIAETLQEVQIAPSGPLYTALMSHLNIDEYQAAINMLKEHKLVKESNHLLTWIGPVDWKCPPLWKVKGKPNKK